MRHHRRVTQPSNEHKGDQFSGQNLGMIPELDHCDDWYYVYNRNASPNSIIKTEKIQKLKIYDSIQVYNGSQNSRYVNFLALFTDRFCIFLPHS